MRDGKPFLAAKTLSSFSIATANQDSHLPLLLNSPAHQGPPSRPPLLWSLLRPPSPAARTTPAAPPSSYFACVHNFRQSSSYFFDLQDSVSGIKAANGAGILKMLLDAGDTLVIKDYNEPILWENLERVLSADVKKQTVFFLQTVDVWSTSSAAEDCRCGPQTVDVLASEKQTAPK
ncbi:hypothetical protein LXL04_039633 [Taraxacum kok-saghyz]